MKTGARHAGAQRKAPPRDSTPRRRRRRVAAGGLFAAAALALALSSCSTVDYYWQGVRGQAELIVRSEPIHQVLAAAPDGKLRHKLELVVAVREFATRELGLPDNGSYRSYADLERPFVVWNVVAAAEFSLAPHSWCFPVAGCVGYRGYFDESRARAEASRLRGEGYDVSVGGVPAYSTLGYFDDPVLNTFIHFPDYEVARLIFHELAHQVLYVRDDTTFNESFATAVEEAGIERWFSVRGTGAPRAEFERMQRIRADFRALIARQRAALAALYASGLEPAEMRRRKAAQYEAMRAEYQRLKAGDWGGYRGYDAWFARANNASIAAVGLYTDQVPLFREMLARAGGDFRTFYRDAARLAGLPPTERVARASLP
jgi:predicted aminopeptidase